MDANLIDVPGRNGTAHVRNLTRRFGPADARPVLDALDLDIQPGEFVALLGVSGSGKTTLLRTLAGLDPVPAGCAGVVVDGSRGLLTGLSFLLASDDAIARRRDALLDFCRRLAVARRWADAHRNEYAAVLAAEIGVSQPVARLTFETDTPLPVPIDAQVVADEQRTADRYLAAGVIRTGLDAARLFDASFNPAVAGGGGALPG